MSYIHIPRLNLLQYTKGTASQKELFSNEIGQAFTDTGFITVTNHGISKELIDEMYQNIEAFFSLPAQVKDSYEKLELAGQRGYTTKGREKAKDAHTPDLKEFWQTGQYVEDGDPVQKDYPANVLVKEIPKFNENTKSLYQQLETLGKILLNAIAQYLQLPENYFADKVHNGNSILRAIHYFPITEPQNLPSDAVRAGAHVRGEIRYVPLSK